MGAKLTTEQLKAIKEATCSNNIGLMVDEILEFRNGQQWLDIVTKPIEQNPHAALIAQCDKDKVDYPDFYDQLWQWAYPHEHKWFFITKDHIFISDYEYRQHPHRAIIIKANELKILSDNWYSCFQYKEHTVGSKWQNWTHNCDFINTDNYDYRLNPHWEKIIEFHQCSDEDKKCWQMKWDDSEWINSTNPDWSAQYYRLRPKVCQVTLQNGKVLEYPEPVRVPLEIGQEYWVVMLACGSIERSNWDNCNLDKNRLKNNVIHLTEQAAQTHLRVLQAVNAQVAL